MNEEIPAKPALTDQEVKDSINYHWKDRDDYVIGPGIRFFLKELKARRDARKNLTERLDR